MALTPLRSIAVDKSLHVYGTPVWIDANLPIDSEEAGDAVPPSGHRAGHRLGDRRPGARRHLLRRRQTVEHVAGRMKDHGEFVMLVPKSVALKGDSGPPDIPLPQRRPAEIATRTAEATGAAQ